MMETLISSADVRTLARDISATLRDERIIPLIREAEDMYVRPSIGDSLYMEMVEDADKYPILLNGGSYDTPCGERKYCSGLKRAAVYYTYAKLVLNNQTNITSWGVVQKNIGESTPLMETAVNKTYNDAKAMADRYMSECIDYISIIIYPSRCGGDVKKSSKTRITPIGE